ncbi:MAG TPA: cytochrome c oxidase subunit 3 [Usitatibacter sp.]|jgi:cytochrome c oxidase subunit I+III|nr:cytochrome c oxidase subunit 3 [Usitatibacter sp.]
MSELAGTPASVPPERRGTALDVAQLPSFGFSHRSLMWWGTLGVMAIEGTVFAMVIMSYFYLRTNAADEWPLGVPVPGLLWGTLNVIILLVSGIPNHLAKKSAERYDLGTTRMWLVVCAAFAVAFVIVRLLEFTQLHCRWDSNAYGSVVWGLLGLHTLHLVTDLYDTVVLTALFFTGPLESKRFVDVSENAVYWYFVVLAWLPIYAVIYWAPRL